LDTDLPFAELRPRSRINDAAQAADNVPDFSERIRAAVPPRQSASVPPSALLRPLPRLPARRGRLGYRTASGPRAPFCGWRFSSMRRTQ
jgi:hypothetical protein